MSERVEEVKSLDSNGNKSVKTTTVRDVDSQTATSGPAIAARIVWFIAGIILSLLAIRLVFILLGANQGNAFVDFIYSVTYPLVMPFFGIFNYDLEYGVSAFELATVVAMVVYALVAAGIANLLTIKHRG